MRKPIYDLYEAKCLADDGKIRYPKTVVQWLENHGYSASDIKEIILSIEESGFYKSDELKNRPGVMADIYYTSFEDDRWYVKFYIDESGNLASLAVWSCRLDGFIH